MNFGRIPVDFNEMLEPNLVLLSKEDIKLDTNGNSIYLTEGLDVFLCETTEDKNGLPDRLIADGKVESIPNNLTWMCPAKWCCRIDDRGIGLESEE